MARADSALLGTLQDDLRKIRDAEATLRNDRAAWLDSVEHWLSINSRRLTVYMFYFLLIHI